MIGKYFPNAREHIVTVVPGAIVAFAVFAAWPTLGASVPGADSPLGTFGTFLIIAFVIGNLIQAPSALIHRILWLPFGGLPTEWVLKTHPRILSLTQHQRLIDMVTRLQGRGFYPRKTSKQAWRAITREIYSAVSKTGRTGRIDAFNKGYALMRELAAAFLIAAALLAGTDPIVWHAGAALGLASLALTRAYLYGKHYARELFVEFIGLEEAITPSRDTLATAATVKKVARRKHAQFEVLLPHDETRRFRANGRGAAASALRSAPSQPTAAERAKP